jgi:signal transduction histidine kinase
MTDILALSRDTLTRRDSQNISAILADVAAEWMPRLRAIDRQLSVQIDAKLPWVNASPEAVRQILDVLIHNAMVHGAGTVQLTAESVGTGVIVAVADEGTAVLDKAAIFERRNTGSAGTGIGLALAQRLAQAEDLRLVLVNPGPHATFHLAFAGR